MTDRYEIRIKVQLRSSRPLYLNDSTPSGNDRDAAKRAFVSLAHFCRSGSDLLRVELWDHERGGLMQWVDVADQINLYRPAPGRLRS